MVNSTDSSLQYVSADHMPLQTNHNESSYNDYQQTTQMLFYAWGIVGNIISLLGIMGNILSISVLANRRMRSSTSYYLIALAVFDTVVLISMMLFLAIPTIGPATGLFQGYNKAYPYIHPFAYPIALISQTCSIYTTVAFTVERYIAVCKPLHAANMCTINRAKKVIVAVMACCILFNIPRMFEYEIHVLEEFDPVTNTTHVRNVRTSLGKNKLFKRVYFMYLHTIVMVILPFVVLLLLNIFLIRAVNNSRQAHGKVCAKTRKENNLTVMLISVVVVFLLCQVPSIPDNIFMAILPQEQQNTLPYITLTSISQVLSILNSAVNFYLYCVFGNKFRRVFLQIYCPCLVKNKLQHGTSDNQTSMIHVSSLKKHKTHNSSCFESSMKSNGSAKYMMVTAT